MVAHSLFRETELRNEIHRFVQELIDVEKSIEAFENTWATRNQDTKKKLLSRKAKLQNTIRELNVELYNPID